MIDLFGIRAKKAARRLAQAQAEKEKYQERKRRIDDYLKKYRAEERDKARKVYESHLATVKEQNSICPKCKSKNVVHRITRLQGEVHGSGSSNSSSSHFLFASSSSHSSRFRVDGSMDTLPVNKCKDCGHEWCITEAHFPETNNAFTGGDAWLFYEDIKQYLELEYDPYDKTETCNSLEEKREAFLKGRGWRHYDVYKTAPRYMLDYALFKGAPSFRYGEEDIIRKLGIKSGDDEYSYVMPDEIYEIAKRLIEGKGAA